MSTGSAVGTERVSRVVGYAIEKGSFQESSPNLPQKIIVFGEANTDKQSGLTVEKFDFTTAKEVGDAYGYGSPLHQIARILRPINSQGVGGIPTTIIPQVTAEAATATTIKFAVTASAATKSTTHYVVINGRNNVDGEFYAINVVAGEAAAAIEAKMIAAVNAVLGAPVVASVDSGDVLFTSKWKGVSSVDLNITIDTNGDDAGVVYAQSTKVDGTGAVSLTTSLALFGNEWNTIVVNPYGDSTTLAALESFNGVPGVSTPTGRYSGIVFKPFMALFGSVKDAKADLIAITDASARKDQVTNVLCPAPKSSGMPFEAAANMTVLVAPMWQDNPHLDVSNMPYPDMPIPTNTSVGDMENYENRDYLVKRGCSTVNVVNGKYTVQDLVTTYHPAGEEPPQFRYARNLNIDWNVRYSYFLQEQINVLDHAIIASDQPSRVGKIVKPKQWKQILISLCKDLGDRALITDVAFFEDSIRVATSTTNPDRFETTFSYKRSSYARICATVATAGFAFGIN